VEISIKRKIKITKAFLCKSPSPYTARNVLRARCMCAHARTGEMMPWERICVIEILASDYLL